MVQGLAHFSGTKAFERKGDGGNLSGSMDCATLASMPNAPMSLEAARNCRACSKADSQAASDPSAQRPGWQMSCAQITAELKQQQYAAQDKRKSPSWTRRPGGAEEHQEGRSDLGEAAGRGPGNHRSDRGGYCNRVATAGLVRGGALNAVERLSMHRTRQRRKESSERIRQPIKR